MWKERDSLAMRACKALLLSMLTWAAMPAVQAWAQLPHRVRIVVPFAVGGPVDFAARVLADSMREQTGIPVIVENRTGANGAVAAAAVKQAAPDGENLLFTSSGMLTISPHLESNLPYDVAGDFIPVTTVTYSQSVMVVGGSVPARNLKEFVELARTKRPPFAFGSGGRGNITHGYIELFKDAAKIELLHVPYKGTAPALADVLGGQITGTFVNLSVALPHARSGKVKVLGIVGTKRSALAPDVPTFEEQGYTGIDFMPWTGILAPRATRPEVVKAIANAVSSALAPETVKARLRAGDATAWVVSAEEFSRTVKSESERWKKLIAEKNMRAE